MRQIYGKKDAGYMKQFRLLMKKQHIKILKNNSFSN